MTATAPDLQHTTESLYRDHAKPLRAYVLRLVPGYDVRHAEDVVHETFLRTIKHIDGGKEVTEPKGFLYTTARNLITSMFYRGRKNTEVECMPDIDRYETPDGITSPETLVSSRQELDQLVARIAQLPAKYQEAFVRRRIWGESCAEIGRKMHLSEKAVSNYAAIGWQLLEESTVREEQRNA